MDESSALDMLLLKCLKSRWEWFDHRSFQDSSTDAYTSDAFADIKDDMVKKLESFVTVTQPRDNYRELMELAIIFLGCVLLRRIFFFELLELCTKRAVCQRQYTLSKCGCFGHNSY